MSQRRLKFLVDVGVEEKVETWPWKNGYDVKVVRDMNPQRALLLSLLRRLKYQNSERIKLNAQKQRWDTKPNAVISAACVCPIAMPRANNH